MPRSADDKRVQRTRKALVGAFNGLMFERGYTAVSVDDVVDRAQVGRSTFYEHFRGKDAILSSSFKFALTVLADSFEASDNTPQLTHLLEHFWEQRVLAREVLAGVPGKKIRHQFVTLIEQRLAKKIAGRAPLSIPPRLAAAQLAEGMFAPIAAWLMGESHCSASALAATLRRVGRASLEAVGSGGV